MKNFCKWVQSLGLYYSFHKIEDLHTLAQNTTNISWAFLKSSAINTANLNNVNPKIIELKGAFLNIGFSFKSISKKILNVKNETIFLDFTTLSIGVRKFNEVENFQSKYRGYTYRKSRRLFLQNRNIRKNGIRLLF